MGVDFSKFDEELDQKELQKNIEKAKENSGDVPKGDYTVGIDKMEVKATKAGKPMFFMQLRIKDGKFKNHCLFFNRVIYGTKNDANMISSVLTILEKFETETTPEFKTYSQFVDNVADIYEEIQGAVECDITYHPDAFNSVSIKEVFDAA
jgi:hypothetical protein